MRVLLLLFSPLAFCGEFTTPVSPGSTPSAIAAITTDKTGNTYVVGGHAFGGSSDVFVSKVDPNGKVLFERSFAGNGTYTGRAIAIDPAGDIYIAGRTTASDLPLIHAIQSKANTQGTGFVVKLSNDGQTVLYSTYFGGSQGMSVVSAIATDAKGNLYLTGTTGSADFPQTPGLSALTLQNPLLFVAEISADGASIVYSAAINMSEQARSGIAVDAAGNAYTFALNSGGALPITPQTLTPNGRGALIIKVNANGAGFGYMTYIAEGGMLVTSIAADSAGSVYVGGGTTNRSFATTIGVLQANYGTPDGGNTIGFLAKINPAGNAFVWATYLGGPAANEVYSITLDANGNVWATGSAFSAQFPNMNGWTTGTDYLAGIDSTGARLIYSALYPQTTMAQSVSIDPSSLVHVAGTSGFVSAINPTAAPTPRVFVSQNVFGGTIAPQVAPAEAIALYGPSIGPSTPITAIPTNGLYPTSLGGVQVMIDGAPMPLLYVSANQINGVVPMGIAPGRSTNLRVVHGPEVGPEFTVWIASSSPAAFPTVINQDGTINSSENPAKGSSVVYFYATGWQSSFSPLVDGQVATLAKDVCAAHCRATANYTPPTICVGFCLSAAPLDGLPGAITIPANVTYGGAAPAMIAGISQVNVQLGAMPASSSKTLFSLTVSGPGEGASVGVSVWVTP